MEAISDKRCDFPNCRFFCQETTPFVDCKVTVAGRLKANKGVNTPDVILAMSPITEKDGNSGTYTVRTHSDHCNLVQTRLKL